MTPTEPGALKRAIEEADASCIKCHGERIYNIDYDINESCPYRVHAAFRAVAAAALKEAAARCHKAVPLAHTYTSENADIYRAADYARDRCVAAIRALLEEVKCSGS